MSTASTRRSRALVALPLALAVLLAASPSRAQVIDDESPPPPVDLGTHPDEGLMIAGGTLFGLAVTVGLTVLMPLEMANCFDPSDPASASLPGDSWMPTCEAAPRAGIPFAHVMGGGIASIAGGPILLIAEVIGLFIFIGGAAHHHPNDPRAAPQPGDVALSGAPGADVGLGLTVHL